MSRSLLSITISFLLICGIAQAAPNEASSIEDVTAEKHFLSLQDIYTDGNSMQFCVEMMPKKFALWNPVSDEIKAASNKLNCGLGSEYHFMRTMVSYKGEAVMVDKSFSGAQDIFWQSDHMSAACAPAFPVFYRVQFNEQTAKDFYIVTRLSKPQKMEECGDADIHATINADFDTVSDLNSIDLKNGKTLLFSRDNRTQAPVVLRVSSLPNTVWSSGIGVYIIPADALHPKLQAARDDLNKRYAALLTIIRPATPSFDCAKATGPVEKLICSNNDLATLDSALADQWQKTLLDYDGTQRASLTAGQKTWLKLRKDACYSEASNIAWPDLAECMSNVYQQRIEMLKQQAAAHQRVKQTDFDALLDEPENLTTYDPKKMGSMYYSEDEHSIHFDIAHLPLTCRELYTYAAGNWKYSGDTIGSVSESFAKSTCAFKLLSTLNTDALPKDQEKQLSDKLHDAIQSIQDEAEYHDIANAAFGDFTASGKKEVLAIVFSHDTGTLHFYTLYWGYYDATGKLALVRVDHDAPYVIRQDN